MGGDDPDVGISDAQGAFRLGSLAYGEVELFVYLPGERMLATFHVDITAGASMNAGTIELARDAWETLEAAGHMILLSPPSPPPASTVEEVIEQAHRSREDARRQYERGMEAYRKEARERKQGR